MTLKQYKILKQALKIMKREISQPKYQCKHHAFSCLQCQFDRFVENFDSIVNFIFDKPKK